MDIKRKVVLGVMTVASLCGFSSAKAQTQNASKAKTVNVQKQAAEFWLNSTDGARMSVNKNKQGGVDIQTTDGLGWSVSRTGKVSALGDMPCLPEDIIVANTIAYAVTGNSINKDKGYKQRNGESAVRSTNDGLKFFVNSQINKEGKKERTVWFIAESGYPDLHGPAGNEISWEKAQTLPSIQEENNHLTNMFTDTLRPEIPITEQTSDEMAVIRVEPKENGSEDLINLHAFNDTQGIEM